MFLWYVMAPLSSAVFILDLDKSPATLTGSDGSA